MPSARVGRSVLRFEVDGLALDHQARRLGLQRPQPLQALLVDRALALNPSFARGWYISGILKTSAGQNDLAIEHAEASLRLSPRGRFGTVSWVIGGAHFLNQRFDEAVPKLLLAIQDNPHFAAPYRYLAACYAHMGRLDDAREIVARLRAITPLVVGDEMILRNPEQRELYLSGLRLAVGETT